MAEFPPGQRTTLRTFYRARFVLSPKQERLLFDRCDRMYRRATGEPITQAEVAAGTARSLDGERLKECLDTLVAGNVSASTRDIVERDLGPILGPLIDGLPRR